VFRYPWVLTLIIFFFLYIYILLKKRISREALIFTVSESWKKLPRTPSYYLYRAVGYMPFAAAFLLIIALAGPQKGYEERELYTETRDIMIALDASGSMAAMDFNPNRLEKAKEVVKDFIASRPDDRIGLVVFAGRAFTHCPLTLDHRILKNYLDNVHLKMIEDGTAIGNALATCVSRLKDSEAKTKIIILLTDGANNRGNISPQAGAEMAESHNIKIYALGVGSEGSVKFPVDNPMLGRQYVYTEINIDEALLKEIAGKTQGKYYYVRDEDMLKKVFEQIDTEEKTLVHSTQYTVFTDKSRPFRLTAMVLLVLYAFLSLLYFSDIP